MRHMYERMLDKNNKPTTEEFLEYCGSRKEHFQNLDRYLSEELNMQKILRFPYGNHYGWGFKYSIKSKHICDVFAEKDAFTVMVRLENKQFERIYDKLHSDMQKVIDGKYACGDGGWIQYRVINEENLQDIMLILQCKVKK